MGDILEFKVTFGPDGITANNMLLTRVDHNLYSVEETPILIEDVSYKDIIEADLQHDGSLLFRRVVKKSEMQTHSFVLAKKVIDSEGFTSLLDRVTEAEGNWEILFGGFVLIHLPSGCKLDPNQELDDICNKLIRSGESPMHNLLRNALAIIAGIAIGGVVNMALVTVSPSLIPPPAGVDVNSAESLRNAMHLFEPRHFIMPFLAHAVGTLAGALAAYLIAASYKAQITYTIGAVFLCGGVAASVMIPAPTWFIALDLLAAYLPMAWLGIQIGTRMKHGKTAARKSQA